MSKSDVIEIEGTVIEKLPNDMQIFITTTERLNMHWNREVRFYDIEQGRIKEVYK